MLIASVQRIWIQHLGSGLRYFWIRSWIINFTSLKRLLPPPFSRLHLPDIVNGFFFFQECPRGGRFLITDKDCCIDMQRNIFTAEAISFFSVTDAKVSLVRRIVRNKRDLWMKAVIVSDMTWGFGIFPISLFTLAVATVCRSAEFGLFENVLLLFWFWISTPSLQLFGRVQQLWSRLSLEISARVMRARWSSSGKQFSSELMAWTCLSMME